MNKFLQKLILLATLLIFGVSHAAQFVDASETVTQTVTVSNKDYNRISIDGGYIKEVNVSKTEADTKKDEDNGVVYIKPLVKKPVTIFVTSENKRNYVLVLKPSDIAAEKVIIREGVVRDQQKYEAEQAIKAQRESIARNSEAYMSSIKRFVYGMATNEMGDEISCSVSGEEVPLWKEAILIRKSRCSTPNLNGQIFVLHNVSSSPMVVEEQEFYKKTVIATAIRKQVLNPNEETEIYVVFGRGDK